MTLTKNREAKRGGTKIHISQTKVKYDKDTLTRVFRNRIYKGGGSGGGRRDPVGEMGGGTQPPPLKG